MPTLEKGMIEPPDPRVDPQGYVRFMLEDAHRTGGFSQWNGTSYAYCSAVAVGFPVLDGIPYETTPEMRASAAALGQRALGSFAGWWRGLFEPRVRRGRERLRWLLEWARLNPGKAASDETLAALNKVLPDVAM